MRYEAAPAQLNKQQILIETPKGMPNCRHPPAKTDDTLKGGARAQTTKKNETPKGMANCQYPPAKTDDTLSGGAPEPRRTTRAEKVTKQTIVGVVAQKKTHQASTYLSVFRADTFRYMEGGGDGWVSQP